MFSLSMMTVRMEIEHVFLKEEMEGISCFPLTFSRFSVFFPCFATTKKGQPFTMEHLGPDHIYSIRPSYTVAVQVEDLRKFYNSHMRFRR